MPNVIILISGIFLGIVGFYLFYKFLSKKKLLTPADCNSRDAEDFLKKRGFQIVEKKRQSSVVVYVNGKGHLNTEAADFIVERDRKRFPGLEILLLNLNGGELQEIKLKFPKSETELLFTVFVASFIVLGIVALVVLLVQLKLY